MQGIKISGLSKAFALPTGKIEVLANFNASIERGKFVSIIGPNGCGKTTLLKIISGLARQDSGSIAINGRLPEAANIGFVFQNASCALLPWLTIEENIALGLKLQNQPKNAMREKTLDALKKLNLVDLAKRYPYTLSGGQKQKVLIARAIALDSEVFLFDAPFNGLDLSSKLALQSELARLWEQSRDKTALFVSHEIDEAILLSDKILVLGNAPASIAAEINVGLPRPRNHGLMKLPEFNKIKAKVLDHVYKTQCNKAIA